MVAKDSSANGGVTSAEEMLFEIYWTIRRHTRDATENIPQLLRKFNLFLFQKIVMRFNSIISDNFKTDHEYYRIWNFNRTNADVDPSEPPTVDDGPTGGALCQPVRLNAEQTSRLRRRADLPESDAPRALCPIRFRRLAKF